MIKGWLHPAVCLQHAGFRDLPLVPAHARAGIIRAPLPLQTIDQECAAAAGTSITVPPPLSSYALEGRALGARASTLKLSLSGEHQRVNASLAVQLAAAWEGAAGGPRARERAALVARGVLPEEYQAGLQAAAWPGRSQVRPAAPVGMVWDGRLQRAAAGLQGCKG